MKNVEIKARCPDPDRIRHLLEVAGAVFRGVDVQRDTYFHVPHGRLKLREGTIENNLIYYHRPDQAAPARSDVMLHAISPGTGLGALLTAALGVRVVVQKRREIYFAENVKFHIDEVEHLGAFVEIEAIDRDGSLDEVLLLAQCRRFIDHLGIEEAQLVEASYSDLLLELSGGISPRGS